VPSNAMTTTVHVGIPQVSICDGKRQDAKSTRQTTGRARPTYHSVTLHERNFPRMHQELKVDMYKSERLALHRDLSHAFLLQSPRYNAGLATTPRLQEKTTNRSNSPNKEELLAHRKTINRASNTDSSSGQARNLSLGGGGRHFSNASNILLDLCRSGIEFVVRVCCLSNTV
jgi:hypothetical protein